MTTDVEVPPSPQSAQPRTPGHVFVIHGRLQDLAHDAVIVPTDTKFDVDTDWAAVTGVARPTPPERWADERFGPMAEQSGVNVWFLDVTAADLVTTPTDVTERLGRLLEAITDSLRSPWRAPVRRRAQHLIALPLLGSGGGGIASAAMVSALLETLQSAADKLKVDVAVVVPKRARFNALQWHRRRELTADPEELARSLGERARHGRLALMVGAGVSAGAGLPNWGELIKQVAGCASGDDVKTLLESAEFERLPMLDQAELIQRLLGDRARAAIVDAVSKVPTTDAAGAPSSIQTPKPSLSHFLLAGLRCEQVATTNYDLLYEAAVRSQERDGAGHGDIAVLPYGSLKPGHPWILKLHGDADHRKDIVLSRSSFVDYDGARQAVGSLFQAMLMTRHVLFVGLSFTDDNVLRLTHHVTKVRGADDVLGTALALDSDPARERLWEKQLTWVGMGIPEGLAGQVPTDAEGRGTWRTAWQARALEVLLDQVAMWAVSEEDVLLDDEVTKAGNPLELTEDQLAAAKHGQLWRKHVARSRTTEGLSQEDDMGSKPARRVGLTMAERLRAVEAGPPREVRRHGFLVPWTKARGSTPEDAVTVSGSPIATQAVPRTGRRAARSVCNTEGLDIIWSERGVAFVDVGTKAWYAKGELTLSPQLTLAEALGQPLPDEVSRWTAVRERGWVRGGDLGLPCPRCNRSVEWFDWCHADAPPMRNTFVLWCPEDGVVSDPVGAAGSRPLAELIDARRVLDSRIWAGEVVGDTPYWVYAIDLLDTPGEVYVGKSIYSPEDRRQQHEEGERSAKVFRKGARPGELRTDLPPLPPLTSDRAARAAERWVGAHYEHRGFRVHGDGRR